MKNPLKLSFKNGERATGLARVAHPWRNVEIKANKIEVGYIYKNHSNNFVTGEKADNLWHVRLRVKHETNFKHIQLKATFETDSAAKDWLREKWDIICGKYEIYISE